MDSTPPPAYVPPVTSSAPAVIAEPEPDPLYDTQPRQPVDDAPFGFALPRRVAASAPRSLAAKVIGVRSVYHGPSSSFMTMSNQNSRFLG